MSADDNIVDPSSDLDIRAYGRSCAPTAVFVRWTLLLVVAVIILVWMLRTSIDGSLGDDDANVVLVIGIVVAFCLAMYPGIRLWFASAQLIRVRKALRRSPSAQLVPFLVTRVLADQAFDLAEVLWGKRRYLPVQSYATFSIDEREARLTSGFAFATDLVLPIESIRAVELGAIAFPIGSVTAIDIVVDTPLGERRLSLYPMRPGKLRLERDPIIGRYVDELHAIVTHCQAGDGLTRQPARVNPSPSGSPLVTLAEDGPRRRVAAIEKGDAMSIGDDDITVEPGEGGEGVADGGADPKGHDGGADGSAAEGEGTADGGANPEGHDGGADGSAGAGEGTADGGANPEGHDGGADGSA